MSQYYNIATDYEPKITGKRDGDVAVVKNRNSFDNKAVEKEFNDFFMKNYKKQSRVLLNSFHSFPCEDDFSITYFPKTQSVNRLDFMAFGPYEYGIQFLMSRRVYEIISKYKLPIHNKIPARIDTFEHSYYLVGFPMIKETSIDFMQSVFFNHWNPHKQLIFTDIDEYNQARETTLIVPKKIILKEVFEFDIIGTIRSTFFSSNIIDELKKEGITGYKIKDGILYNYE